MNPAILACLPWWPHYHDIFMSTVTEVRLGNGDYPVDYRLPRHASSSMPLHRVWSSRSWHFPVSRRAWTRDITIRVIGSPGLSLDDTVARVQSSTDDE